MDPKYQTLYGRVKERLQEFKCSRSAHLEKYARNAVDRWERNGHSRTYVFLTAKGDDIDVAAFFAVGMNVISFSAISKSKKKLLMGDFFVEQTGAFCITELARSDDYSPSQLPGSKILDEAKVVVKRAREYVGGRFLIVDSRREVFNGLYSKHDFKEMGLATPPAGMESEDFVTSCCIIKDW